MTHRKKSKSILSEVQESIERSERSRGKNYFLDTMKKIEKSRGMTWMK